MTVIKTANASNRMSAFKLFVRELPVVGIVAKTLWKALHLQKKFPGSERYWEERYLEGGTSGAGSYSRLATFKASVINEFTRRHYVNSVIEFGCGDGNQLSLAAYDKYLGFDVSKKAIDICKHLFPNDETKTFKLADEYSNEKSDLALSLDVIYHLVEDRAFDLYMRRLFGSSKAFVIIYSSNDEGLNYEYGGYHVRHRKFGDWIAANATQWTLLEHLPNSYPYLKSDPEHTSLADFYFYQNTSNPDSAALYRKP